MVEETADAALGEAEFDGPDVSPAPVKRPKETDGHVIEVRNDDVGETGEPDA